MAVTKSWASLVLLGGKSHFYKKKKPKEVLSHALTYTMQTQHTAKLQSGLAVRAAEAGSYKQQ